MSVKYNVIEKTNPQDPTAPKKFYASSFMREKQDIEDLTMHIEKRSTMSGADIRGVLYAIVDVVPDILSKGDSVSIGDLGSFRVSISSEAADTAEEVSASSVKGSKIIFTPGKKFKQMLSQLEYEKA